MITLQNNMEPIGPKRRSSASVSLQYWPSDNKATVYKQSWGKGRDFTPHFFCCDISISRPAIAILTFISCRNCIYVGYKIFTNRLTHLLAGRLTPAARVDVQQIMHSVPLRKPSWMRHSSRRDRRRLCFSTIRWFNICLNIINNVASWS